MKRTFRLENYMKVIEFGTCGSGEEQSEGLCSGMMNGMSWGGVE